MPCLKGETWGTRVLLGKAGPAYLPAYLEDERLPGSGPWLERYWPPVVPVELPVEW
jgi:hypothetical protein